MRSGLIENSIDGAGSRQARSSAPGQAEAAFPDQAQSHRFRPWQMRDRGGDNLTLHLQALHPRVDQTFAELIEIKETNEERGEPARFKNTMRRAKGEAKRPLAMRVNHASAGQGFAGCASPAAPR